jgi:hypothetical protein
MHVDLAVHSNPWRDEGGRPASAAPSYGFLWERLPSLHPDGIALRARSMLCLPGQLQGVE